MCHLPCPSTIHKSAPFCHPYLVDCPLSIHRLVIHPLSPSAIVHQPSFIHIHPHFLFICCFLFIHPPFFNLPFHLSICRHLVLLSISCPLFISIRTSYSFAACYPFTLHSSTCCFTYPFIHAPFIILLSTHRPIIHLPAPILFIWIIHLQPRCPSTVLVHLIHL